MVQNLKAYGMQFHGIAGKEKEIRYDHTFKKGVFKRCTGKV